MANYATLKAAIVAAIKQNGNNEITGNLLQQQLLAMVNSLGVGYQYAGIATPATNPGTPDQNVFYLASTAGTYTNLGGLVLADGEIAVLKYNGAWSKDSTGAATLESVNQLGQYVSNPEYIQVITDADGKILDAIKPDGKKYLPSGAEIKGNVDIDGAIYSIFQSPEWVYAIEDAEGKVLCGIKKDGEFYANVTSVPYSTRVLINELASKLNSFNPILQVLKIFSTPEWIEVTTDNAGKVIEGIKANGKRYINDISIVDKIGEIEQKISYPDLKIVFFGDSITEFVDHANRSYCDYIHEISGAKTIKGGIGGSQWAQRTTPVLNPTNNTEAYAALDVVNLVSAWCDNDWTMVDNAVTYLKNNADDDNTQIIQNLKNNPIGGVDVVTFQCGCNDHAGNMPLGTIDSTDKGTVMGAINTVVAKLYNANPSIKIYLLSNLIRYCAGVKSDATFSDVYHNSAGYTMIDMNNSIKDCAIKYHLPYADNYFTLGWNKLNFDTYFLNKVTGVVDLVHPFSGFKVLADKIWSFMVGNKIW